MSVTEHPPLAGKMLQTGHVTLWTPTKEWLMRRIEFGGRIAMTVVLDAAVLYLGLLGLYEHLVFTVPSRYDLLMVVLDARAWSAIFGLAFIALTVAIFARRVTPLVVNLAASVIGWWGLLGVIWQVTAVSPVSWVGPGLAVLVAVIGWILATSWASVEVRSHSR